MIKTVIGLHGTDEAGIRYALLNPCAAESAKSRDPLSADIPLQRK